MLGKIEAMEARASHLDLLSSLELFGYIVVESLHPYTNN
jgi:hypothetical protein